MKNLEISERAVKLGKYVVDKKTTVRGAAKQFKISKSTVHKDITSILKEENISLYNEVKKQLDYNKSVGHLRGGEATRQKNLKKY